MGNKSVLVDGKWWHPFEVYHTDPDGRKFSFVIMAISFEHAACVVDDIKQTAKLGGQIVGTYQL